MRRNDSRRPRSAPRAATPTALRCLRLAGLTVLLGLVAGAHPVVYAQENTASATVPQPQVQAGPAPQAEPAVTETASATSDSAAAPSADGKPVDVKLASAKKDKTKKKKEKAPKLTPVHIEQGILTVDGWTGKARLNYDITDLKYIYVWAPGIGTIVASNEKFPLGKEEPGAFNGNTLTLEAGGHIVQISSEKKLLKDKKPQPAYVYLDSGYKISSAFPQMGYGNSKDAPYAWPGAKQMQVEKGSNVPPPLPAGLRAAIARPTCTPVSASTGTPASAVARAPCPAVWSPSANGAAAAPSVPQAAPSTASASASAGTATTPPLQ